MKKLLLYFIAGTCYVHLHAQNNQASDHFVIKGQVKNSPQPFVQLGVSGFMSMGMWNIPVTKDGSFSQTISITHPQDFFIEQENDGLLLFAVPGDTIELNWNYNEIYNTFHIACSKPWRQQELNTMLQLSKKIFPGMQKFFTALNDQKKSDSAKFELIKKDCAEELNIVLSSPVTTNTRKIITDIYFRHVNMLQRERLLEKHKLAFRDIISKEEADSLKLEYYTIDSDILNEAVFYESNEYRDFIFDRVRFYKPFNSWMTLNTSMNTEYHPNYTMIDCHTGTAFLNQVPAILDWYLAKAIQFGFEHYTFTGTEEAYEKFFPQIKTPMFRDTLKTYYATIQRLKPGTPAPAFTLKDSVGKNVSLKDFKGKVVYIDFWGVGCGPCIYDIKNYSANLHDKYKNKDVVFVNICVDVEEKEWKENLMKLKLNGTNLLAKGWVTNPVCMAYNVNAIPHYILIDQKGNIVNNNASRAGELLAQTENEIDKLLK